MDPRSRPRRFTPSRCSIDGCELPALAGAPLRLSYRAPLLVRRGVLAVRHGEEVHAASFLRQRLIVLDAALRRQPGEWRRILVHELFHFAWLRLGNPARASWRALLARELAARARGELGWSAEWRKRLLTPADLRRSSARWRDYSCEAFCDTAAWLYAGLSRHEEFTLSRSWRKPRRLWFIQQFGDRAIPL
ncbi:MAG: hypothetical protein IT163_20910 [Bryobacterales bacterium]|nr:hypothetical protein [Bryobacterales bacterium]